MTKTRPKGWATLRVGLGWHAVPVEDALFGGVVLVAGSESLLAERAVARLVAEARQERPEAGVSQVAASALDAGALMEVTGASLFASSSIVVVDDLAELPPDLGDDIVSFARTPVEELALILVHAGGQKGKGLLDRLKKARVRVVECPPVKAYELPQFAVAEARGAGGRLEPATAERLVAALGGDLRAVAGAVRQLLADSADGTIADADVHRYFAGRADVTSFTVADGVMAGKRDEALGALRWALDTGVPPVLVTSAMASALRNLGRYLDARDARLREAELARQIGVPPWKVRGLSQQAREWAPSGVADAIRCVARVDGEIKGAASDPGFALEQMVIKVTACRGRGRGA